VAGRLDLYDGSGTEARINWELKFARGGVGAIVSSWTGVHPRGRVVPNFATIDRDDTIPFWRELGRRVHEHDCRYVVQLAHAGRQRDIPGFEYEKGLSSTDKPDPLHGFLCERMTHADIRAVIDAFVAAARRARQAGLDGVEVHGANGYLFTQFLSSAINDRDDEYGGPLENRARLLLEVVRAIRAEVGDDFHLQAKISATEYHDALFPWLPAGNTVDDFQTRSVVERAIEDGSCDAVTIARPLVANSNLVELWRQGHDRPPRPCTFSNKCLFNVLEHPIGCYDERRFASREEMIAEVMSVFSPPPVA
jgi:2,4-dienoyl-CoA reductase-like NADH-dependent reductase (Old Yellow Enzyme family)